MCIAIVSRKRWPVFSKTLFMPFRYYSLFAVAAAGRLLFACVHRNLEYILGRFYTIILLRLSIMFQPFAGSPPRSSVFLVLRKCHVPVCGGRFWWLCRLRTAKIYRHKPGREPPALSDRLSRWLRPKCCGVPRNRWNLRKKVSLGRSL